MPIERRSSARASRSSGRGGSALYVTYTSTFSNGAFRGSFSEWSLVNFDQTHPTSMTRDDVGISRG
jgi:hypothetical protein